MANDVFANDREISCKAADGKSVAAFPDVCFTPPETAATPIGVPIPYPNTAFAKDTTSGSKTVKISGKEVMLKDRSYFKTSTGDEAGCAAKKGILTSVNKGKAYFTSWSMDVKFEGENVVRHLDLTTHNHASTPGNTGTWLYVDTRTEKRACKKEMKRVDKKCKPTKKQGKKTVPDKTPGAWKKKYCKGLEVKPPSMNDFDPKKIEAELDNILDVQKQLEAALTQARDTLVSKFKEFAAKKTAKVVAKSAIKGWLGPIGWAWTAYDVVSAGIEIDEMKDIIDGLNEDIENMKGIPDKLKDLKNKKVTPEVMADAQALIAKANPCLRARKCMLVPYRSSHQSTPGDRNSGCCPGQTPHHLIPKSAFDSSNCPGYNKHQAPTVCVEGTSHSRGGSHQKIHDVLEKKIEENADANGEMPYTQARTNAIDSLREIGYTNCSRACLAAQLDNYHKKACGGTGGKVKAQSAKGPKQYEGEEF
jgi:hypothetical protein